MQNINEVIADPKIKNVISYNVRKFGWAFDSDDDARQEAYICLLEIIKKYDNRESCKLPSYLSLCLRRRFMSVCKKFKNNKLEYLDNLKKIHVNTYHDYTYNRINEYDFLSQKQKNILYSYYYERKKLREIAQEHNISIEWARVLIKKTKEIIRENFVEITASRV